MSEWCVQCLYEYDPQELRPGPSAGTSSDMIGLSTEEDTRNGLYAIGLCEGCGGSRFDHNGFCQT